MEQRVRVSKSEKTVPLTDKFDLKIPKPFRDGTATLKDFVAFAESRCPPKTRIDIDEILKRYDLKYYDPVGMCMKSYGRGMVDYIWIDFNDSGLHWDDIRLRD